MGISEQRKHHLVNHFVPGGKIPEMSRVGRKLIGCFIVFPRFEKHIA
jgi:hypothetical protein